MNLKDHYSVLLNTYVLKVTNINNRSSLKVLLDLALFLKDPVFFKDKDFSVQISFKNSLISCFRIFFSKEIISEDPLKNCIFCNIPPSKYLYNSSKYYIIDDIHKKMSIHKLIIPFTHTTSFKNEPYENIYKLFFFSYFFSVIKNLKNCTFIVNNGTGQGQIVKHLHLHLLSGNVF